MSTVEVLERTIEERDRRIEVLEAAFTSDTDTIQKMKDRCTRARIHHRDAEEAERNARGRLHRVAKRDGRHDETNRGLGGRTIVPGEYDRIHEGGDGKDAVHKSHVRGRNGREARASRRDDIQSGEVARRECRRVQEYD